MLGKRSMELTYRFMADLAKRIVLPTPHDSDAHAYKPEGHRPTMQLSTDAFACYAPCVDAVFGRNIMYGQLIKDYRNAEQPGRYAAPEMVGTKRIGMSKGIDLDSICTSHVERQNLTIRTFMRRFTRLSLGFSKRFENLAAAVAMHIAHYNFCRRHNTLRMTPAMAANVTGRCGGVWKTCTKGQWDKSWNGLHHSYGRFRFLYWPMVATSTRTLERFCRTIKFNS
jgi:hypothetical protein